MNGEAAVYTRQSTKHQERENKGSLEFQRDQVRYPRAWGYAEEKIKLYEDSGLTGSGTDHRAAFMEMTAGIKAGQITAVFASDQSRLGRNAVEWFQFLGLCGEKGVLPVIDGRIINLGDSGDHFTSKVIALVHEYDLETRRGHILRGVAGRLKDRKAVSNPPTGYVALKDERKGTWILDPDPEIQAAIRAVFRIFLEERSCARTVRRMIAEGTKIPARKPGCMNGWVSPSIGSVRRILTNPSYAGDYVYRRRIADRQRGKNSYGQLRVRVAAPDERVPVMDHHPAYVSREIWNDVQMILKLNAPSKRRRNLGPGGAVLQGLITCGLHRGRAMAVDYKEPLRDGRPGAFYFHCHGDYEVGGAQCGAIPGRVLELAVVRALFARLTPVDLQLLAAEWEKQQEDDRGGQRARDVAVEQARREVADLRKRWRMIDSDLRDLAEDVECALNEALAVLRRAEAAAQPTAYEETFFTEAAFGEMIQLCADLPGLFYAATTTDRDRKEIIRTIVDRVEITGRTPETISAVVYWQDGSAPTAVIATLHRYVHRLIRELAEQELGNAEIAKRLNDMGYRTSRGRAWTRETVWVVRFGKGRYRHSA